MEGRLPEGGESTRWSDVLLVQVQDDPVLVAGLVHDFAAEAELRTIDDDGAGRGRLQDAVPDGDLDGRVTSAGDLVGLEPAHFGELKAFDLRGLHGDDFATQNGQRDGGESNLLEHGYLLLTKVMPHMRYCTSYRTIRYLSSTLKIGLKWGFLGEEVFGA